MAEVAEIAPLNVFGRPNMRRSNNSDTFSREKRPRETSKDWLLRGMQQAYDAYRKIQKDVKQKNNQLPSLLLKANLESSSFDMLNDYVNRLALETDETNFGQVRLIRKKLQYWLIDSLQDYEQEWFDPLSPSKVLEAIDEIRSLEANWDGQNAEPVSIMAIESAKKFLTQLGSAAVSFEPFADPEGGLGLESHKKEKSIYIIASPDSTYTYVLRDGRAIHRGSKVCLDTMRNVVSTLY